MSIGAPSNTILRALLLLTLVAACTPTSGGRSSKSSTGDAAATTSSDVAAAADAVSEPTPVEVCTWFGSNACLNDLEAAAACWQPDGECENGGDGTYTFANGARAVQSGNTSSYFMGDTLCFSGSVDASTATLTFNTPDDQTWIGVAAADGASVEWTCPSSVKTTVKTGEQQGCLTASTSDVSAKLATCFQ